MAVKAGPVLALTAKWLLVPIALGVVGYYFVGPKIGVAPPTVKRDHSAEDFSNIGDETEETASNKYPEPDVEVSVKRGTTIRSRSDSDRPRRSSRPKPKKEEAPKKEPEKEVTPPPIETTPPPVEGGGTGETIPVKETTSTTGGGEGG